MVIDRLPPQVGGVLFSVGPQVLVPDRGGVIYSLAGTTQKVTVSSVGGATSIDIVAGNSSFGLRKNLDNGLWSGELLFNEGGSYDLKAKSIDGAENKTDRELNRVVVLPSGVVRSEDKGILSKATVSVFYFEPTAGEFVLWDGSAFGQVNPQKTDSEGRYGFLVPPGKYFVEVEMSGYRGVRTKIFSLKQTTPLNMDFVLRLFEGIQVGPFKIGILLLKDEVDFKQASFQGGLTSSEKIVGNEMPYFSFPGDGFSLSTNDLKGKSTVVSFLSIWAPQAYEQLSILNELGVKEINNLVIMSQDSSAKVNTYKKIGGYKVRMVSDVDGELVEPLGILNIPTHIFLDRKGVVKKKLVGVLSKEELLDNIIN
jgi:peroxiredoxin